MNFRAAEITRLRQAIVTGRIAERVTERPLNVSAARLQILQDGAPRDIPATFGHRAGGWFTMLPRGDDLPAPAHDAALELRLTVTLADGRSGAGSVALNGADLARIPRDIASGGAIFTAQAIAGAPFAIDIAFDPAPVWLSGVVIGNSDPAIPVAGASINIDKLTTTTDASGRFRIGPLPVAPEIEILVTHDGTETRFRHRPDFTRPQNMAELSIPI